MPSSDIMNLFGKGELHSGGSGKVVTDPKQAVAIKYSYARKEAMKRAANKKKKDD